VTRNAQTGPATSSPPLHDRTGLIRLLAVAAVAQVAGRGLDAYWHANNDEFEGARQQLEAHWLIWLGVLATLAICVVAMRRLDRAERGLLGYRVTLISGLLYAGVAVWHFIEHANLNDPEVAHVFLALGQAGMLVGIVLVFVLTPGTLRRERGPTTG
jgi:undecaprenyl pyrophosphate phosphatase UppP